MRTTPLIDLPPCPDGLTLVLGAGGFLGSHFAAWLARGGARARLLDLSVDSIPAAVRQAPNIEVRRGNLIDPTVLSEALRGVDRVFYLVSATAPSTSVDRVGLELRVNVSPMVQLLDEMRACGTPLIVFPSSGGTIYGDEAPPTGHPEASATKPSCSYGLGKLLTEDILRFYADIGGPAFLVARIANPYGPSVRGHNRQGVINAFLDSIQKGQPLQLWGDGNAVRDFIYADDVVGALGRLLADDAVNDVFNVGSGSGHTVREIIDLLQEITGGQVPVEQVPLAYPGVERNVLDISRIRQRVGWSPGVDLRRGITALWESLQR